MTTLADLEAWYQAHKNDRETKLAMQLRDAMTPEQTARARAACAVATDKWSNANPNIYELWIVQSLAGVIADHLSKLPAALESWLSALATN